MLPEIRCYRRTKSGDDPNAREVSIGPLRLWFSYNTLVAFYLRGVTPTVVCRQNDWSMTTGKHLNAIEPEHSLRVSEAEFYKQWYSLYPRCVLESMAEQK